MCELDDLFDISVDMTERWIRFIKENEIDPKGHNWANPLDTVKEGGSPGFVVPRGQDSLAWCNRCGITVLSNSRSEHVIRMKEVAWCSKNLGRMMRLEKLLEAKL